MAESFGLIKDSIVQVVTLSSGTLALSLTFSNNFKDRLPTGQMWQLWTSWGLLLLATLSGVCALHALAGIVHTNQDVNRWNLRVAWILMDFLFFIGLIFLIILALGVFN